MSIVDKFKNWKPQAQRKLLEELLMIHAGTPSEQQLYGELRPVNFVQHENPESIHLSYWTPVCVRENISYETLMSGSIEAGFNGLGEHVGNTPAQLIEGIRSQGCWAFTDYQSRTVHVWADEKVDQLMVMQMIASEVGHLTTDRWDNEQLEELRTFQMGLVANVSLQLFNQVMENRASKLEG